MRNFSSVMPQSSCYAWYVDRRLDQQTLKRVMAIFNDVFENPPSKDFRDLVPSEQRVISDFLRYARTLRQRKSMFDKSLPASFIYHNLNTGRGLLFVTHYGFSDYGFFADLWC